MLLNSVVYITKDKFHRCDILSPRSAVRVCISLKGRLPDLTAFRHKMEKRSMLSISYAVTSKSVKYVKFKSDRLRAQVDNCTSLTARIWMHIVTFVM